MSSERSESALIALRQILRATDLGGRSLAKSTGLSPSQFLVLQILADAGALTPSAIAKEVSLSQATVTTIVERLASWDMVLRERDTCDRRKRTVELTDKGRRTVLSAPSPLQSRFTERFEKLAGWEQASIVAALERTATLLDAEDIDAAPVLDIGALAEPGGTIS